MDARHPHLQQQIEHRHGGRHEQNLAQHLGECHGLVISRVGQQVLDVQHAHDIVERLAKDRYARMSLLDHRFDDPVEGRINLERHDVDPRHHHVGGGLLVQLHDITEDRPLLRIEGLLLVLLDQLLERSAQVLLAHPLAGGRQGRPHPRPGRRRRPGGHGARRHRRGRRGAGVGRGATPSRASTWVSSASICSA